MTTAAPAIPSIDRLLRDAAIAPMVPVYGHAPVVAALRTAAAALRAQGLVDPDEQAVRATLITNALVALAESVAPSLIGVFNLTGTVLHTNLGRAALSQQAVEAVCRVAAQPTNLEYRLDSGTRGDRDVHVEHWLTRLTGAEAATVVNNNAAAVMLVLNTFAHRREVLVSRGELVEIGGSFRIPDVMTAAGARLREVGTTNRTHLRDYADALHARTGLILKIHPSNYRIEGFTAEVPATSLAALGLAHGVPLVVDLGSGTLLDFKSFGLPHEETVQDTLAHGADLVTFSGDKLLGGPQAGLIVGRAPLIAAIKKNAMTRALRVDKLTLAALEATLSLYGDPARARTHIPTLRLLTRPTAEIAALTARLLAPVASALRGLAEVSVSACASQIGSGALPVDLLPSAGLSLRPIPAAGSVAQLAARLRGLPRPVIGRIHQGAVMLDLRCLEDEAAFLAQLHVLTSRP